jgi:hypothetical protein
MPSANAKGFRIKVELVLDRSPAGGTIAAFDFTEFRHVRQQLYNQSTPIP